jgi:hypothetical protein
MPESAREAKPIDAAVVPATTEKAITPRITVEHLLAFPDSEARTNWVKALVEAEVARQNFSYDQTMARQFAASHQFDDLRNLTAEQAVATAMVKIQLGRAWGFNAADSVRYIYFVNGKPAVENEMVATKLQQAGYFWDVEWMVETVEHKGKPWQKCVGCRLWPKTYSEDDKQFHPLVDRKGQPVSVEFTEADADHAMVWDHNKTIPLSQKPNYQSWASDMYYWRAISRLKKYYAPHVLRGAMRREEALEIIPTEGVPPNMLPRELRPATPEPPSLAEEEEPLNIRKEVRARRAEKEKGESNA